MAKHESGLEVGKRFGRLVIIEKITIPCIGTGWRCKCDCGTEKIIKGYNLKSGNSRSCGCLFREAITTHGLTKSRVYVSWKAMHQRCGNPNANGYWNYGERGIGICERWGRFENFLEDMGHPPPRMTLERVDNNGPYEKSNCRWASYPDQLNNRRNNVFIEAFGRRQTLTQWARELKMSPRTLHNRIFRGGTAPETAMQAALQRGIRLK